MIDAQTNKSFIMPQKGAWPSFQDIVNIVLVGIRFDLSVCIICFSQNVLEQWRQHLADAPRPVRLLDVTDTSLPEMRRRLAGHEVDMTVLSGARAALMGQRTTLLFISQLVIAVPRGMVIAA